MDRVQKATKATATILGAYYPIEIDTRDYSAEVDSKTLFSAQEFDLYA